MSASIKSVQKRLTIDLLRRFYGSRPDSGVVPVNPRSIALFAQERFGDIIMMSPLIRSLKNAYPDCTIDIISVNQIANYLIHDKNINRVLKAKHPDKEVKTYLRTHEFDLLFNTKDHPSVTFLYLTATIKARQRIGLNHQEHRGFFNHLLNPSPTSTTVQKYLSLLDYLNISYTKKNYIPYLPKGPVSKKIDEFAKNANSKSAIAINLSASQSYKEWPLEKWSGFLSEITGPVFILAMPEQAADKKELESRFSHVLPSPPTTNIFEAGHLIRISRALLSPDTALVHLASCYNTPVVALYRQPLDLQNFPPFSKNQQVVMASGKEISRIPVQTVIAAYNKLLQSI